MSLHTEWISYGEGNKYSGYVARDSGVKEPMPSVIVLQEIWGVDEHIQDVTRRLAQAGYVAFAPDLFAEYGSKADALRPDRILQVQQFLNNIPSTSWGNSDERKAAISRLPEDQQNNVTETLGQIFNVAGRLGGFIEQITATSDFLRSHYTFSLEQGVASVGFCLGGALSGVLASKDEHLRGAVIFYGNPVAKENIDAVRCPILGFYGELDKRISDTIPEFDLSLKSAGKSFEYHIYPGAPHAFFNDTRPTYHVQSARDAFARTLDFLQRVLS